MSISGIQSGSTNLASSVANLLKAGYYDPKDTNQDGIVSAAESLAYSLKHPEVEVLKRLRTPASTPSAQASSTANNQLLNQYTQKGALNAGGKVNGSSFSMLG